MNQTIFVLHRGNGPDNGMGQFIGEPVGWVDSFEDAVAWSRAHGGYYRSLSNLTPASEPERIPIWTNIMNKAENLLRRLTAYEEMSGAGACPVYLRRWTLARGFGCALYLHHFIGDDWAIDPHDHPRRFVTLGLKGWYWEDVFNERGERTETHRFQALWLRSFPAAHVHRVRASECGNTWTLVLVLPKSRAWGFIRDGEWIPFRQYVFGGKARKSC